MGSEEIFTEFKKINKEINVNIPNVTLGDIEKSFNRVKNNHEILNKCNRHEFEKIQDDFDKHKCKNCGGIAYATNVYWYNLGFNHAINKKES